MILNFKDGSPEFNLPEDISFTTSELLISNYLVDTDSDVRQITLRPYEARVYLLK